MEKIMFAWYITTMLFGYFHVYIFKWAYDKKMGWYITGGLERRFYHT
jgi:hypothetical protein